MSRHHARCRCGGREPRRASPPWCALAVALRAEGADQGPGFAGEAGGVEAELGEDGVGLAVGDVGDRGAEHAHPGRRGVGVGAGRWRRTISAPTPPSRTPSSAVITSGCWAASASISRVEGHDRARPTRWPRCPRPRARRRPRRPRRAACRRRGCRGRGRRGRWRAAQPGAHLVGADRRGGGLRPADGGRAVAELEGVVEHLRPAPGTSDGANTVMPGTLVSSTMSSTPWCDGPSSPVMPARSRQNTTGWPWRPTS